MALDALSLHFVCREIEQAALGGRITKVHQLSKEELVLTMSGAGVGCKLFLSARADAPRLHVTRQSYQNPQVPPMFCMLLRKHLTGGKLLAVRQPDSERIVFLDFACTSEIGDPVQLTLACEIMGRHSNIILIGEKGRIIDSVKRVDLSMSSVRQVLPGMQYQLPPAQNKLSLFTASREEAAQAVADKFDGDLHRAAMKALAGISPVVAGEIEHYVCHGQKLDALKKDQMDRLRFFIGNLQAVLQQGTPAPTMVLDGEKAPKDLSFLDLAQFGYPYETRHFETMGQLLDSYYAERDTYHRMKQKSGDLFGLILQKTERIQRKLAAQRQELLDCADRDRYRVWGDLLSSSLYQLQKGQKSVRLQNYYSPALEEVEIPLDPRLTPAQNAQHCYKKYKKLDTAEKKLRGLIEQGQQELDYLESVFDSLTRATGEDDLAQIRQELAGQGYVKRLHAKVKTRPRDPLKFVLDDGYTVLVGRNNLQNDQLTLRTAERWDIWFHTKSIPGSHVILLTGGEDFDAIPERAFTQAAIIAATHSKAGPAAQVAVDYTLVKNIKKPPAAKPGMVIFDQNYSAYVTPDRALCDRLAANT
ncbi:Fibronectin-binding protein A N-terminus (FbpA) [Anaerotruncus sp. 2789STDY5834896]|uniref:Rqc2 homolog RqcH n=1 Tax=uncultured Anaerotruncus sp. TaxID=905011 RepID=A0A1C6HW12_9FIRM|nr:Fibronectin-binding protein A N-terminus (FbpA) [uncultured Anaerotruncus sp.]